jgi:hypothetical protein
VAQGGAMSARSQSTWAAALFALLAAALTWPLVLQFGTRYPAAPGEGTQDLWQNLWNLWWVGEALRRGVYPFSTDMLFYPRGGSLLFHPLNLTSGVIAFPFAGIFGITVAYNLLVLLGFALSGLAIFLLARRHGCGAGAAVAGGIVYTAAEFHVHQLTLGHLEQVSIQWLPLYALALDRMLRPERALIRRDELLRIGLTALALLAVLFTSLYHALYAALLTMVWVMIFYVTPSGAMGRSDGAHTRWRPLLSLLLMTALALAVAGPALLLPMAQEQRDANYMLRTIDDAARGAIDPAGSLLPPPSHPLRALVALPTPRAPGAFLGYVALTLAAVGMIARPRAAGRWMLLAALAWLLSLGPALPFYQALYALPPIQAARYPSHFTLLALLGLSVAAAIGADAVARRAGAQRATFVGSALALLALFELHPRGIPLQPPIDSPFYRQIAAAAEPGSVFELPINRFNNQWVDMAAQIVHRRPILYGGLARPVPRPPFERMALFRELERPDDPPDIVVQPAEERLAALRYFGLRFIAYHRSDENGPVTPPSADSLSRAAGAPVVEIYSDDELVGFRIDPPPGPADLPPFLSLGEGWYGREAAGEGAQRWIMAEGGAAPVYAVAPADVTLRLTLVAFQQPHEVAILLDGAEVARMTAQPWPTEVRTPPFTLPAGDRTLQIVPLGEGIAPRDVGMGEDPRPLTVAVQQIAIEAP